VTDFILGWLFSNFLFGTGFALLKILSFGKLKLQPPDIVVPEANFDLKAEGLPPYLTIIAGAAFWAAIVALIIFYA
jgi:hypothetical protein